MSGISQCINTSRSLLTKLLTILDDIKIRTVLEDEFELLVSLCNSLLSFHKALGQSAPFLSMLLEVFIELPDCPENLIC